MESPPPIIVDAPKPQFDPTLPGKIAEAARSRNWINWLFGGLALFHGLAYWATFKIEPGTFEPGGDTDIRYWLAMAARLALSYTGVQSARWLWYLYSRVPLDHQLIAASRRASEKAHWN